MLYCRYGYKSYDFNQKTNYVCYIILVERTAELISWYFK